MRLANVRPDDILRCDVRGDRFWALVTGEPDPKAGGPITSLIPTRPIPALRVKASQVIGHWRRSAKTPPPGARPAEASAPSVGGG
jgi:hypothetical protein